VLGTAEIFDPVTATWSAASPLNDPRSDHTATLLSSGKVMVVGGQTSDGTMKGPLATVEVYTPHSDRWVHIAPLHEARVGHSVTELTDGRVLVIGGMGKNGLARPEIFDPRTGRWTPAASLATSRRGHTAVRMEDGRILVAGGLGDDGALASVEIYDPEVNRWIPAPPMVDARDQHAAALLPDGTVLVTGGYNLVGYSEVELDGCEIYDPVRNEWKAVDALTTPRRGHSLTVLTSGHIVVIGGALQATTVSTPEVLAGRTGEWGDLPPFPERLYGSATLLTAPDSVLVVGGWNDFQRQSEVAMLFKVVE
jgi:N-acetylneuraminic acid mutarotase